MTEIRLTLDDPAEFARWARAHASQMPPTWSARADQIEAIAAQIEEQVKPVVEEPEEFGSVVRAGIDGISDRVLWLRSASGYWFSETSRRATFSDLYHPEVLRIGVGEAPQIYDRTGAKHKLSCEWPECPGNEDCEGLSLLSEKTLDLTASVGDTTADEAPADVDEFMTSAGFDRTPAQDAAYAKGAADMKAKALAALRFMRTVAITAEQAGAYEKALKAVGELP